MDEVSLAKGILLRLPVWEASAVGGVARVSILLGISLERYFTCWAEARLKIARMTLTIKLDGNWSSFQLANSAPPLSVTGHAIAPSARMARTRAQSDVFCEHIPWRVLFVVFFDCLTEDSICLRG